VRSIDLLLVAATIVEFGYLAIVFPMALHAARLRTIAWKVTYWLTPFAVSISVFGMLFAHRSFNGASFDLQRYLLASLLMSFALASIAWLVTRHVFVCEFCGAEANTYRNWWRKGVFWCPGCNRLYLNGIHRSPSSAPTGTDKTPRAVKANRSQA
jgi:hypothetical protein